MMLSPALAKHFEGQANGCEQLGSPFTARLCRLLPEALDELTNLGQRVANWPGDPSADALALRLCGGLHYLAITEQDQTLTVVYPPSVTHDLTLATAVKAALRRNEIFLNAFIDSPPQTNEVARAGMLLPGFLEIARQTGLPLDIHEIGSSGGLNLLFDRFGYRYGDTGWGDPLSPVQLAPAVRGEPPPLAGELDILKRDGCDIAPVDVSDAKARLRLQSYVWADQELRLQRLCGALQLVRSEKPDVMTSDAASFVRQKLETRRPGAAFVLFHSIMWQYMPADDQARIKHLLEAAGRGADATLPIAWLRMEPVDLKAPYATILLTNWPSGETRELARCCFHGRWIEWLAAG